MTCALASPSHQTPIARSHPSGHHDTTWQYLPSRDICQNLCSHPQEMERSRRIHAHEKTRCLFWAESISAQKLSQNQHFLGKAPGGRGDDASLSPPAKPLLVNPLILL